MRGLLLSLLLAPCTPTLLPAPDYPGFASSGETPTLGWECYNCAEAESFWMYWQFPGDAFWERVEIGCWFNPITQQAECPSRVYGWAAQRATSESGVEVQYRVTVMRRDGSESPPTNTVVVCMPPIFDEWWNP